MHFSVTGYLVQRTEEMNSYFAGSQLMNGVSQIFTCSCTDGHLFYFSLQLGIIAKSHYEFHIEALVQTCFPFS